MNILLLLVLACGDQEDVDTSFLDDLTGDEAVGETLFDANCSSCHGATAEGDSGPSLLGLNDSYFVAAIKDGVGDMPSIPSVSEDEQNIADIIAFIEGVPLTV